MFISTIIISAAIPTFNIPAGIPSAFAPLYVAIFNTSFAGNAVGSMEFTLCSRAAVFISSNISRLLLEAVPSVPSATFTSRLNSSGTGAIPDASFMLLTGQWTALTPFRASISISPGESHIVWAASTSGPKNPSSSSIFTLHIPYCSFILFNSASVSST